MIWPNVIDSQMKLVSLAKFLIFIQDVLGNYLKFDLPFFKFSILTFNSLPLAQQAEQSKDNDVYWK